MRKKNGENKIKDRNAAIFIKLNEIRRIMGGVMRNINNNSLSVLFDLLYRTPIPRRMIESVLRSSATKLA